MDKHAWVIHFKTTPTCYNGGVSTLLYFPLITDKLHLCYLIPYHPFGTNLVMFSKNFNGPLTSVMWAGIWSTIVGAQYFTLLLCKEHLHSLCVWARCHILANPQWKIHSSMLLPIVHYAFNEFLTSKKACPSVFIHDLELSYNNFWEAPIWRLQIQVERIWRNWLPY